MGLFDAFMGYTGHQHCWHFDNTYRDNSVRYCCITTCDLMQFLQYDYNDNRCIEQRSKIWVDQGKYGSRYSI